MMCCPYFIQVSTGPLSAANPLALAIGREVIAMLAEGTVQERSQRSWATTCWEGCETRHRPRLWRSAVADCGRGSISIPRSVPPVPERERALERGVIVKETHTTTLRIAPPLVIDRTDLDHGIDVLLDVLG